jgi:hypothetical protein
MQNVKSAFPPQLTVEKLLDVIVQQALINGLPESYDTLKTNLRCMGTMTTDDLKLKILNEYKSKEESVASPEFTAHAVSPKDIKVARPSCTNAVALVR